MVFPSFPDPIPLIDSLPHSPMASSTNKPQKPLHNFPLQDLKWSINQANCHRSRRPADCPQRLLHFVSDGSPGGDNARAGSSSRLSPNRKTDKLEKKLGVSDSPNSPAGNSEKKPRTKICIRLKTKQINPAEEPVKQIKTSAEEPTNKMKLAEKPAKPAEELAIAVNEHQDRDLAMELDDAEETIAKTWNLRPRRKLIKGRRRNGGAKELSIAVPGEAKAQEQSRPESSRPKGPTDAMMTERKGKEKQEDKQKQPKKTKFSIPLTKFEIEEDIYALTGSKPSRKPLKRPKHVQKQLDNLFPGMWLSSITPDMYKVHETPAKIR